MAIGIDPKVDSAFKRLFGIEENAPLLVHLLNAVLASPRPVTAVDFLAPQSQPRGVEDKVVISDVLVRDQGGRQFLLEMQRRWSWSYFKRLLFDWALFHSGQLRRGETYQTLRPTVAVCFLDEAIGQERYARIGSHQLVFRTLEVTHGVEFCDDFVVHVLVLPWFMKGPDQLETDLDRWCFFLRYAADLDPHALPAALDILPIRQACEVLVMFGLNPDLRAVYDAEERARLIRETERKDDLAQGRAEGLQEGELIGSIRMCQKALKLPQTPREELGALSQADLTALLDQLTRQLEEKGA